MRRVVSVRASWGDYVLGVCDLRSGQALSVGSPPRRLVRFRHGRAWLCRLPSADVDVERALSVGETVTMERDGLQYSVTCSETENALTFGAPRPWLAPLGGVAAAGALLTVLALLFAPRPPAVAHHRSLPSPAARDSAKNWVASPDPPVIHVEVFAEAAEPQPRLLKPPGDLRCGDAEMGALMADGRNRYGVSGPKDNPDPHLARPTDGAGYPTATAIAPYGELAPLVGSRAPTARFGRDAALGTDPVDARGNLWGDVFVDAEGESGLGLAASPGGIVKRIDVAPVAEQAMLGLRVVHTGLRVDGARKASEIGQAMAARFDEFRGCAETAPLTEARQVQVEFDVTADGRAAATRAATGRLEQCLDESVARVVFAPEANALAHVVYPLYFVPATAELRTPPAEQGPRPAPCDCGG